MDLFHEKQFVIAMIEYCTQYIPILTELNQRKPETVRAIGDDCLKISSCTPLWLGDKLKTMYTIHSFQKLSPWQVIALQVSALEVMTNGQFSAKADTDNPLVFAAIKAKERINESKA